eukprot:s1576_g21.t1
MAVMAVMASLLALALIWPLAASENCVDSPEVGLLQTQVGDPQTQGLSSLDLARAKKIVPGPQFSAAHSGHSNELLNKHLLRISAGKAKRCEDFTHHELDGVLDTISAKAHDVLQGIYETNKHPGGDETWRDPRGREGASLGDTLELNSLESKIPADLLDMAKLEKKCYDAAMAFTHSVPDKDKKEILINHLVPLLPVRPAHETNSLLQESAALADGKKIFDSACANCHSGGVDALATFKDNVDIVTNGKGSMPPSSDKLSKKDIEEVAQYVMDQTEKGW